MQIKTSCFQTEQFDNFFLIVYDSPNYDKLMGLFKKLVLSKKIIERVISEKGFGIEAVMQGVKMLKLVRIGANGLRRLHSTSEVGISYVKIRKNLKASHTHTHIK